jgi:hypothetical protein
MRGAALGMLLAAGSSWADERFDHRGSLGLFFGPGVGFQDVVVGGKVLVDGVGFPVELGGTLSVGYSGDELVAEGLATLGGNPVNWGVAAGYRNYFGQEQVKTFVTVALAAHFVPTWTLGPRADIGVQYELLPTLGVYAKLTADVGYGGGLRFSGEASMGLQLRTYVLE